MFNTGTTFFCNNGNFRNKLKEESRTSIFLILLFIVAKFSKATVFCTRYITVPVFLVHQGLSELVQLMCVFFEIRILVF
jgi:hypothetical protein